MKHCLKLLTLALALSLPAFASSVDFSNSGGTLTGTSAGLNLTGSLVVSVIEPTINKSFIGNNLGSFTFSTGALTSGSLTMGGTFDAGGSFTISLNGSLGLPNGVVFNGSFDAPSSWVLITLANGTHNYVLTGTVTGLWINGDTVSGATVQLTINTGKGFFNGQTVISSGNTDFTGPGVTTFGTVPEPSALLYMGSGLLGMAGLIKAKLRR